jgi:hypothetical protein
MKISDDITKFVNHLYEAGCHYPSNEPKGCSSYDEEYLTALFIQATPKWLLENTSELDPKNELWDLLAAFMKSQEVDDGVMVLNYLVENAVKLHSEKISRLFSDRRDEDPSYGHERRVKHTETNRDLYNFQKTRI